MTAEDSKSVCAIGEVPAIYPGGAEPLNRLKTRSSEVLLKLGRLEEQFEGFASQF